MTTQYQGGSEIPGWRTLLLNEGVRHVAFSFVGLSRRVKFKRPWLIADKFPADTKVLLDSGGYSIRKNPEKYEFETINSLRETYIKFVEANVDAVELVTAFDVPGSAMANSRLWEIAGEKFLPIWHESDGMARLRDLADSYPRVGVPQTSVGGRDIVPVLRSMARDGTLLHGAAMTKPSVLEQLPWDSVASTSWLSPIQYGDTIVWTGNELKRYPKKYQQQARKRHRQLFAKNGFDTEKIEAGDPTENLRVSLWSWGRYIENLNEHQQRGVTVHANTAYDDFEETDPETVTPQGSKDRQRGVTPRRREALQILPGFGITETEEMEKDEDGNFVSRKRNLVEVSAESQRVCDTCFLAPSCQAFEAGSTCAYKLPVEARTVSQIQRIREMTIEIQTQRIATMYAAEQQEGGYADPNLSREMELLEKMIDKKLASDNGEFSLTTTIRAKGAGQSSLVSRLFGDGLSERAQALPAPVPADDVMRQIGAIDVEAVEVWSDRGE